jgi:hypothetical protein
MAVIVEGQQSLNCRDYHTIKIIIKKKETNNLLVFVEVIWDTGGVKGGDIIQEE